MNSGSLKRLKINNLKDRPQHFKDIARQKAKYSTYGHGMWDFEPAGFPASQAIGSDEDVKKANLNMKYN